MRVEKAGFMSTMKTTTKRHHNAADAFDDALARIDQTLAAIKKRVDARAQGFDPKRVNWNHVGSMDHLAHLLDEVLDFAEGHPNEA